jgi:hypothetical protein
MRYPKRFSHLAIIGATAALVGSVLAPAATASAAPTPEPSTTVAAVTPHVAVAGELVRVDVLVSSFGDPIGGVVALQYNHETQATTRVDIDSMATFWFPAKNAGSSRAVKVLFLGTDTAAPSSDTAYYVSKRATGSTVVGHIRDLKTGKGIAGARVTAVPSDGGVGRRTEIRTTASGRYEFTLAPGSYRIQAQRKAGGYVDSSVSALMIGADDRYRIDKRLRPAEQSARAARP